MLIYRISFEEALERISFMIDKVEMSTKDKYALTMAKQSLEKQIPKRAIMKGFNPCEEICSVSYLCPICKKHINIDKYCYHCGQAIDWSDTE